MSSRLIGFTDKFAMTVSAVCAVHCFLMPAFLVLMPSLTAFTMVDDCMFHKWLTVVVLPTSLFALVSGCKKHGNKTFLKLGMAGVTLLCFTAFYGHSLFGCEGEKYWTLAASSVIAFAHYRNHVLCRTENCDNDACCEM